MLGRYQIVRELGSGAMAQVSLALDISEQKLVALKRLHQLYALSGGARMRREFRALSSLDHPNIVRVFDHGESGGLPYLALEYVDGVTLGVWLESPRTVAETVAVFTQVCDALEAAHRAGLIHRDLKPENIMVTKDGTAKLMDFGLTKLLEASLDLTRVGAMVGTVLYMSPEQCRGEELDARTDLYALGAVLYRALVGQAPFTGTSLAAVVYQHLNASPSGLRAHREDIPASLEGLVLQLLAKSPAGRPRTALEVSGRLRELSVSAQPEPPVPPSSVPAPSVPAQSVRLLRAPLIGRGAELRQLETELRLAAPGYVALTGEAGVGKSRLLETLGQSQALVMAGALSSDTEPFAAVERLLKAIRREAPAVLGGILPEQLGWLGHLAEPVEGDVALINARRFEAFRVVLERAAGVTVLALENLHWADAGTLAMLAHAVRGPTQTRLVVTYRPEDIAGERPRLLPPPRASLRLDPLPPRDMRALLEARLGGPTEAGLRDALLEGSSGNPWTLDELLRDMLSRDAILEESGVFEWDRNQAAASGLLERTGQRLRHLAAHARAFAEAAAVLGREFQFEDARALLGWDDDLALGALEVLLLSKVLLERPSGDEFQFAHPEYVGWLQAQLSPSQSKLWHAAALGRLRGRADDFALATHAVKAEQFAVAFDFALRAGESALKKLHYSLAERAFRLALEANVEAPTPLERQARFGLAETLSAIGQPEDAAALWQALAEREDETARRSRLQLAHWHGGRGETELALEWLRADDSVEARLARAKIALRDGDSSLAWREALSAYRQSPENAESLIMLTDVSNMNGHYQRGIHLARAAQRRSQDLLTQLRARNFEAGAFLGLRELDTARGLYQDIAETAERIGHLWLQLSMQNNLAIILFYEDRIEETLQHYRQACTLARRVNDTENEYIITTNIVESLVMLGRLEEALTTVESYEYPSARLWATALNLLVKRKATPLPDRNLISAWHGAFYELVETQLMLHDGDYQAVIARCSLSHRDYSWWWNLFELNARLRLGLDYSAPLERLKHPQLMSGIQRALALEYVGLLEGFLVRQESLPPSLTWLLLGGLLDDPLVQR